MTPPAGTPIPRSRADLPVSSFDSTRLLSSGGVAPALAVMPSFGVNSSSDSVQVVRVTLEPELGTIKDAWNELAGKSDARGVFSTHDWFAAAWAWRRLDSTLDVQVVRRRGVPTAILPLIRARPTKGARRLELLT